MNGEIKALRVRISGRVQGVGFRDWARREAMSLGLEGWIRNEPDGTVSALIKGAQGEMEAMLQVLREGPRAAAVSNVRSEAADPADVPEGFRVTG